MMLNTDYGCKWVCKNRKLERVSASWKRVLKDRDADRAIDRK